MEAKASGARVRRLEVQDLFEKRQGQLRIEMGRGLGPLVLQPGKLVAFKGSNDGIHVGTGHLRTARDNMFVPAFRPQPDDGPACVIGAGKLAKSSRGISNWTGRAWRARKALTV